MGIAIILRSQLPINQFRDLLIGSIATGAGNNALLCSGFFQENFKSSSYQVSNENNFGLEVAKSKIKLDTVGIHNPTWKPSYKNFRDNMRSYGANIHCYYKNGLHWHAKVYILSHDDEPIFGIIGSSNLTRNAFGSVQNFNYECDVVLWPDECVSINDWMNSQMESHDFPFDIIRAPYIVDLNNDITVQERLINLKNEILESGITELD